MGRCAAARGLGATAVFPPARPSDSHWFSVASNEVSLLIFSWRIQVSRHFKPSLLTPILSLANALISFRCSLLFGCLSVGPGAGKGTHRRCSLGGVVACYEQHMLMLVAVPALASHLRAAELLVDWMAYILGTCPPCGFQTACAAHMQVGAAPRKGFGCGFAS